MRPNSVPVAFLLTLTTLPAPSQAACSTPTQLDTDLSAAAQSDVISMSGVDPTTCPEVSMTQTWSGGNLIFSDSPESPTTKAILYQDTGLSATNGSVYNRIYAYHVNGASSTMRFTVLIKNNGTSNGTLTVQKAGRAGPTTSFLYAGKLAFQRWENSTNASPVTVNAGSWARIDTTYDTTNVGAGNLIHAIWDYSFDQSHTIVVCMISTTDNPTSVCPGLSVASRDSNHQRGTFPSADKVYDTASGTVIDTASGIQQFPLAGNTTNDSNAVGTDATDGSQQTLSGNYGILYRMHLSSSASDGKNLGFLFNPRGGQWGGAVNAMAGITAGGIFLIPSGSGSTGDNTKGAVEGKYNPGSALTPWLQWMPTGGSSFPLRYVAVPY